jgi:hypothetical protein
LRYSDESTQQSTAIPPPRRISGRPPPLEPIIRDNNSHRRGGSGSGGASVYEITSPLITNENQFRQPRSGDVNTAASLPEYHRPTDREYPLPTRKKSGPSESTDADYYVGYSPEHEQPLPYVEYLTSVSLFSGTGGYCSIDTLMFLFVRLYSYVSLLSFMFAFRFDAFALALYFCNA